MRRFDEAICRNLDLASRREWLETNGLGGFASSTIAGLNTRRYHGLLVAATKPPVGRMLLLSKTEETLVIDGRRFELGCNRYPGVVHPQGHLRLKEFRQDPFPISVYEVEGYELERSIFLVHGENTAVIQYELRGPSATACTLEVRPLIAFRDYHSLTHENPALNPALEITPGSIAPGPILSGPIAPGPIVPGLVECTPYSGLPTLSLAHTAAEVHAVADWYRNFEYTAEQERGLDFREDLFCPVQFTFDLQPNRRAALIASTGRHDAASAPRLRAAEIDRRAAIVAAAPSTDAFVQRMTLAADQFLVRRGDGATVIAGYHWFSDWGRDTMIALPGLTLVTKRHDAARAILLAFASSADQGMLPNRFPDAGEPPEYNTVDATLWFFEAVRALLVHTNDFDFVRRHLYATMADIIRWHERGTRYGIHVDTDGLLYAGEPAVQLTWMDAKVGDWVVTPRQGKPVEIQALWYNALRVMQQLAEQFDDQPAATHYGALAGKAQSNFLPQFWNQAAGCLYDVVNGAERDGSIRPNQIFAVSLFHKLLPPEPAKSVVDVVQRNLLTPYGLRTLAPSDPQYRGRYAGDQHSRDAAYHQGTVWPWLLGPFLTAYLEVNAHAAAACTQAAQWLTELRRYSGDEGLGQIPEIFDGDAPHRPAGCIAQAWSVAELLRLWGML
jgi:predicted glycogen debranching enzyme